VVRARGFSNKKYKKVSVMGRESEESDARQRPELRGQGVPLDILDGWDATTRTGNRRFRGDVEYEDPYVTTTSHPCLPW
jgi:hypothetical protein